MSSIIGHGLCGAISKQCIRTPLSSQKEKWLLYLSVFLSLLPDFDVVVFMILAPAGMTPHRGISHSLLFITIVALFFVFTTSRFFPLSKPKLFLVFFCPLLSHLVLDYLMGAGPPVPFFAPVISRGFLSPIKLVPCAFYSTTPAGILALMFHIPTLVGIVMEIFIFVPIIVYLGIAGEEGKNRLIKRACLVITLLALLFTFYLYNMVQWCPV